MRKLGFKVYPVFFDAPYFPSAKAIESARVNDIGLIVRDISAEHLAMIQNPRFGYGKNFNPCIDCHSMMFNLAGKLLSEFNADFLISGEVVGQRPMSQRRHALQMVSDASGFGDLLVRPLCQKLLPDTLPIRSGWVDKNQLLGFNGRNRTPQMNLAKELGVTEFPAPGGGCLLTDVNYSLRLRELLAHEEQTTENIQLLRYGRHFRLAAGHKLIIGRDNAENEILWNGWPQKILLHARDFQGPLGMLISDINDEEILKLAAGILLSYVSKAPAEAEVVYGKDLKLSSVIRAKKLEPTRLNDYLISIDQSMGLPSTPQ